MEDGSATSGTLGLLLVFGFVFSGLSYTTRLGRWAKYRYEDEIDPDVFFRNEDARRRETYCNDGRFF